MEFVRGVPRGAASLLLVVATGCNGCQEDVILPTLLEAEDTTPVGVWVGEGLGATPVIVPAYAVNGLGAPVPSDVLTVTSDATVFEAAAPGADGWAAIEVTAAAAGRYAVSASLDSLSGEGAAWFVNGTAGTIDSVGQPVAEAPSAIARAGNGVAYAIDTEVWWVGWDGAPPARVLTLPDPVVALVSGQVDSDGVADLIAYSDSRIVLLRGRDAGGLSWGAGWAPVESRTVVGASLADIDGDSKADLSVGVSGDGSAWVSQLGGDGAWGFTPVDALELGYEILAVSTEDLDGDGSGEVTVLTEDGLLRRYAKVDGEWAATLAGSQYDCEMGAGGRLWPPTDVSGDGVPDLIAAGPSLDGSGARVWVITAGAESPAMYSILSDDDSAAWAGVGLGDLTGDGVVDLGMSREGMFTRITWTGSTFELQTWTTIPSAQAIDLDDVDDDGVVDVILGGDTLRVLHGERVADDPETDADETNPWKVRTPTPTVFGLDLLAEPHVGDVNGDGIVDVVALVDDGEGAGLALQGFLGIPAGDTEETLRSGGSVTLAATGTPLGLAVCGTRAYALYEADDGTGTIGTWLARFDLGAGLGPNEDGDAIAVVGDTLACGTFALGEVAVTDATGAITYVADDGSTSAGESIGAVGAMTAVDTDADGQDELVACAEAGCFVAAEDLDGDGTAELVVQDSTGVQVTMGGTTYTLDVPGTLRVDDADGDTLPDLVWGDAGGARIVRAVPGGLTPPVGSWTWRPVEDVIRYGDLDGDGVPDAFLFGVDPDPSDEDLTWVGALLYAHAATE